MLVPPLALSLLHYLLYELLGHHLPLPHVPRIIGYALAFSRIGYDVHGCW